MHIRIPLNNTPNNTLNNTPRPFLLASNAIKAGKSVEDAFWEVVFTDIQDAADVFLPLYNESDAVDGYVSVEVSPNLAHEGDATVDAAKLIYGKVDRQNVYIKIPATTECIPAIEEVIAAGISVNVTVSFSWSPYIIYYSWKGNGCEC